MNNLQNKIIIDTFAKNLLNIMDKNINYTNYRIQEETNPQQWVIFATNEETRKEEIIKVYTNKSRAYAYISRLKTRHPKIQGNRLKLIMAQKGLSNGDLADMSGYNRSTISQWKSNTTQPSYGAVLYLAQLLGVTKEDIISF